MPRDDMEINRRFQDLHTESSGIDWVKIQQVERDICLLYHQLAEYSNLMVDLYYGSVFALPYWEFLDLDDLDLDDKDFIRDGCLVMILAMAWDFIDGPGNYICRHIASCRAALSKVVPFDESTEKLIQTVTLALDTVEQEKLASNELVEQSSWVHKEYVEGYFRKMVNEFENNPIYKRKAPK